MKDRFVAIKVIIAAEYDENSNEPKLYTILLQQAKDVLDGHIFRRVLRCRNPPVPGPSLSKVRYESDSTEMVAGCRSTSRGKLPHRSVRMVSHFFIHAALFTEV